MLQRLSQVGKADCNSGTVDHPESRLGASKFVNEVFECAILIHIDHIQSTWCRGYSSFQKARPGKEDLPALIILDIICMFLPTLWQSNPHSNLTFQIAMLQKDWRCISCLRKAGFMSFHPGHSGCLDGLLSAAAAMQEEMGQDKSGGSWSPYWPFDVSNVSDCSRFWLQLMDSNANKKLVWSWFGLFDFPKGVDSVHEAGAVWPKQSRGM